MNRCRNSQQTELCIQYKSNTTLHKITKTYIPMTLNVNKEKLTILDVQFDNYEDFDAVWYAVGSSMIEDFNHKNE